MCDMNTPLKAKCQISNSQIGITDVGEPLDVGAGNHSAPNYWAISLVPSNIFYSQWSQLFYKTNKMH